MLIILLLASQVFAQTEPAKNITTIQREKCAIGIVPPDIDQATWAKQCAAANFVPPKEDDTKAKQLLEKLKGSK